MAIMNVVTVVWGGSLLAIVTFGIACAASSEWRARLWGKDGADSADLKRQDS